MIVDRDPFEPIGPVDWDRLRLRYRSWRRVDAAIRLALDLETCVALLRGEPVDPVSLDPHELSRASQRRLVRLDLRAIDLLDSSCMMADLRGGTDDEWGDPVPFTAVEQPGVDFDLRGETHP